MMVTKEKENVADKYSGFYEIILTYFHKQKPTQYYAKLWQIFHLTIEISPV